MWKRYSNQNTWIPCSLKHTRHVPNSEPSTHCSFEQACDSSRSSCGWFPHLPEAFAQMPSSQWGLPGYLPSPLTIAFTISFCYATLLQDTCYHIMYLSQDIGAWLLTSAQALFSVCNQLKFLWTEAEWRWGGVQKWPPPNNLGCS